VIREDFDRIATLSGETWNPNNHCHPFLLHQLPSRCRDALENGCGKGTFSRLLAGRADHIYVEKHPGMRSFYNGCVNFSKDCGVEYFFRGENGLTASTAVDRDRPAEGREIQCAISPA
jgi:hypothetical protein